MELMRYGGLRQSRIAEPFEQIREFQIHDQPALPMTFVHLQQGQRPSLSDGFAWLPQGANENVHNIEDVTFVRPRQGAELGFEQDGRLNVLPSLVEGIRTLIQWVVEQPEGEQREVLSFSPSMCFKRLFSLFQAANPALGLNRP